MTEAQKKKYTKELVQTSIEKMIRGTTKELTPKNKKLLKEFLSQDIYVCLYTVQYINTSYYEWEVDNEDYTPNKNFDRLIYLLNGAYDTCKELLNQETDNTVQKDYGYNSKNGAEDLVDYRDLEKRVGFVEED